MQTPTAERRRRPASPAASQPLLLASRTARSRSPSRRPTSASKGRSRFTANGSPIRQTADTVDTGSVSRSAVRSNPHNSAFRVYVPVDPNTPAANTRSHDKLKQLMADDSFGIQLPARPSIRPNRLFDGTNRTGNNRSATVVDGEEWDSYYAATGGGMRFDVHSDIDMNNGADLYSTSSSSAVPSNPSPTIDDGTTTESPTAQRQSKQQQQSSQNLTWLLLLLAIAAVIFYPHYGHLAIQNQQETRIASNNFEQIDLTISTKLSADSTSKELADTIALNNNDLVQPDIDFSVSDDPLTASSTTTTTTGNEADMPNTKRAVHKVVFNSDQCALNKASKDTAQCHLILSTSIIAEIDDVATKTKLGRDFVHEHSTANRNPIDMENIEITTVDVKEYAESRDREVDESDKSIMVPSSIIGLLAKTSNRNILPRFVLPSNAQHHHHTSSSNNRYNHDNDIDESYVDGAHNFGAVHDSRVESNGQATEDGIDDDTDAVMAPALTLNDVV